MTRPILFWSIVITVLVIILVVVITLTLVLTKKKNDDEGTPAPNPIDSSVSLQALLEAKTSGPLRIMVIGDSTVQGFGPGSTDYKVTSWPSQMATKASTLYSGVFNLNNCVGALFGNLEHNDSRVNYTGWTPDGNGKPGFFGLGGACYTTTSSSTFTFQPSSSYNVVEVYSPTRSIQLNVSVNGTIYPLTTPDTTRSNTAMNVYMINLTSATSGLISIQSSDPTKKALLGGIVAYAISDLASVINCGVGGSSTNDWIDAYNPTNLKATLSCYKPDLVIQNLCINNYWHAVDYYNSGSGTPADVYLTQLQKLDDIYAALNIPVLYYTPNVCGTSVAPLSTQTSYVNALKGMCQLRGRSIVDIFTLSVSTDNMLSNGWQDTSDACHPTPAGYTWIADTLLSAIQ